MIKFRTVVFAALSLFALNALAGEHKQSTVKQITGSEPTEVYVSQTTLDIYTVITVNNKIKTCDNEPSTLVFEGDDGQLHAMVYQEVGKNCITK